MINVTVYPFPLASKHNKYAELIYAEIPDLAKEGFNIELKDMHGSFPMLFLDSLRFGRRSKKIIHIHWENIIYGSRFFVKSVLLLAINGLILSWLKLRKFKIVWTMHNYYGHDYPHPFIDYLGRKLILLLADAIIIQQKQAFQDITQKHKNKKIFFIPIVNYVDAYGPRLKAELKFKKEIGFTDDDLVIISLGAIKPYKKFDLIIKVFNSIQPQLDKRIKLFLAGYGYRNYCPTLIKLAEGNRAIKIKCEFIGDGEIAKYLSIADYSIFWYDDSVLTSAGIALSLSYGVPVIARNIPAAEDVKNGLNGYLYNDSQELAVFLSDLLNKPKPDPDAVIKSVLERNPKYIAKKLAVIYNKI